MHTSSTVYESLEYIRNITSDTLEKLRKLHIESVSQLAVQSPRELAIEINDNALFDIDSASKLIASARKLLTEHGVLSKSFRLPMISWKNEGRYRVTARARTNSTHFLMVDSRLKR
jgi:hypothetical protein